MAASSIHDRKPVRNDAFIEIARPIQEQPESAELGFGRSRESLHRSRPIQDKSEWAELEFSQFRKSLRIGRDAVQPILDDSVDPQKKAFICSDLPVWHMDDALLFAVFNL